MSSSEKRAIEWLARTPTAIEVAEHALAFPSFGGGRWLVANYWVDRGMSNPDFVTLRAISGVIEGYGLNGVDEWEVLTESYSRCLPCDNDGIPLFALEIAQ